MERPFTIAVDSSVVLVCICCDIHLAKCDIVLTGWVKVDLEAGNVWVLVATRQLVQEIVLELGVFPIGGWPGLGTRSKTDDSIHVSRHTGGFTCDRGESHVVGTCGVCVRDQAKVVINIRSEDISIVVVCCQIAI